jgi:hypothetical protein
LILSSAAKQAAQRKNQEKATRNVRISSSSTRERGCYLRFAPVSWLASKGLRPTYASAFPDFPVVESKCPRLQLRGSAGFTPASLSLVEDDVSSRKPEI